MLVFLVERRRRGLESKASSLLIFCHCLGVVSRLVIRSNFFRYLMSLAGILRVDFLELERLDRLLLAGFAAAGSALSAIALPKVFNMLCLCALRSK